MRQNPFRFFKNILYSPGLLHIASAAPPTTKATAFPFSGWLKTQFILFSETDINPENFLKMLEFYFFENLEQLAQRSGQSSSVTNLNNFQAPARTAKRNSFSTCNNKSWCQGIFSQNSLHQCQKWQNLRRTKSHEGIMPVNNFYPVVAPLF